MAVENFKPIDSKEQREAARTEELLSAMEWVVRVFGEPTDSRIRAGIFGIPLYSKTSSRRRKPKTNRANNGKP